MRKQFIYTRISFWLIWTFSFSTHAQNISVWLTNADRSAMLQKQNENMSFSSGKQTRKTLLFKVKAKTSANNKKAKTKKQIDQKPLDFFGTWHNCGNSN